MENLNKNEDKGKLLKCVYVSATLDKLYRVILHRESTTILSSLNVASNKPDNGIRNEAKTRCGSRLPDSSNKSKPIQTYVLTND